MADNFDFDNLFADLHPSQVEELSNRLRAAIVNEQTNFKKGIQPMDQSFLESLSDDERAKFQADIEAAGQNVLKRREQERLRDGIAAYKREMREARGKGNRVGLAIREKYRARGLPVDQIDFTE